MRDISYPIDCPKGYFSQYAPFLASSNIQKRYFPTGGKFSLTLCVRHYLFFIQDHLSGNFSVITLNYIT